MFAVSINCCPTRRTVGHLGSGQFANVEKAVWSRRHGIIEVAVKTLHSDASPADKLKFLQEGAMTSQFHHPNVIFLYGIIADKNKVHIYTSICFVNQTGCARLQAKLTSTKN